MNKKTWKISLVVQRQKDTKPAYYDTFELEVDPDEYVLDGIERIWAYHDRTLVFRHACHHSTCGACGMRVNGIEKLTCITPFRDVTQNGGTVIVEPLRNFPVVSDLAVDMSGFYQRMEAVGYPQVAVAPAETDLHAVSLPRLNDCIECGMCISACPIATTTESYVGPGVLAGAQFTGVKENPRLLDLVDNHDGLWRCHSVYECAEVCPSFVEPAWRIMNLRRQVMVERMHNLFHPQKEIGK